MKFIALVSLAAIMLSGCVGAGLEGAKITRDKVTVRDNIAKAKQGNPVAQFKVGEALCCSPRETAGAFYNTRDSIAWLCASARQGYAPAMHKIGKIYSGDVVDGVRLLRRAALGVAGSSENHVVAYGWLRQAGARGQGEAQEAATTIWKDLNPVERQAAARIIQNGLNAKCHWDDVIK